MASTDHRPVVFVAFANDKDAYLSGLDAEEDGIRDQLDRRAETRRLCELQVRYNATPKRIFETFEDERYHQRIAVFHFAGHADGSAIAAYRPAGGGEPMLAEGLAQFLGRQKSLKLVFLNGCATEPQVERLLTEGVPAVIATSAPINDGKAAALSTRFYAALGVGDKIGEAYRAAVGAAGAIADDGETRKIGRQEPAAVQGSLWELRVPPGGDAAKEWSLRAGIIADGAASIEAIRPRYRSALAATLSRIDVPASHRLGSLAPKLQDVFVIPDLELIDPSGGSSQSATATTNRFASGRPDPSALLRGSRRAVILGDMGGGKTTLLRYVALCASEGSGMYSPESMESRIAVLADLAEYATAQQQGRVESLMGYLQNQVRSMLAVEPQVAKDFFSSQLESGSLILCLDGLDKVGTSYERRRIAEEIQGLARVSADTRVFVTSRHAGYFEAPVEIPDIKLYRLLPPSSAAWLKLLRRWCKELGVEFPESLEQRVTEAGTFLLATIAAISYCRGGTLSDTGDAASLARFVDLLMDDWERDPAILAQEREQDFYRRRGTLLAGLGYSMQLEQQNANTGLWLPARELGRRVAHVLEGVNGLLREDAARQARRFVDLLRYRSGLLVVLGDDGADDGPETCSFWHPSMQEFLAARHMAHSLAEPGESGWALISGHVSDARWENVFHLMLGCLHEDGHPASVLFEPLLATRGDYEDLLHRSLMLASRIAARATWLSEADVKPILDRLIPIVERDLPMSAVPLESLSRLARFPTAALALVRVIRGYPRDPGWVVDVVCQMPVKQGQALVDMIEAIAAGRTEAIPWVRLRACVTLHRLGRKARARELLDPLSIFGDDYWYNLREAVEAMVTILGEESALGFLRKAIASADPLWIDRALMSELFESLGQPAEAIAQLLEVRFSQSAEMAERLERLGRPEEAVRLLQAGLANPARAWAVGPALVERRPELKGETVKTLTDIALNPVVDASTIKATVLAILRLTESEADAGHLLPLLREPRLLLWVGTDLRLAFLSRGEAARFVAELDAVLNRPDLKDNERMTLSLYRAEAMLDDRCTDADHQAGAAALLRIARDPKVDEYQREASVGILSARGFQAEAVAACKTLASDETVSPRARRESILKLFEHGEEAAASVAMISLAGGEAWSEGFAIAWWLIEHGFSAAAAQLAPHLAKAVAAHKDRHVVPDLIRLLQSVGDYSRADQLRQRSIERARKSVRSARRWGDAKGQMGLSTLVALGDHEFCFPIVLQRAKRRTWPPDDRIDAARFLVYQAPFGEYRDQGLEILAGMAQDERLQPSDRARAWKELDQRVVF